MSTPEAIQKLSEFYRGYQCHGVVALIEYVTRPENEGLNEIGSSSLGFARIMKEIWTSEEAHKNSAWFRTWSMYIGSRDGSKKPFDWLEEFAPYLEKLPEVARREFSDICGEFARIAQCEPAGDEVWTKGGIYLIPVEANKRYGSDLMSPEEFETFRVKRSRIFGGSEDETVPFDAPFETETEH